MKADNEIKLYIHIPFCVRKCNYCDFLSFAADDVVREKYVSALISQIEQESKQARKKGYFHKVSSIYMGGGTPSVLNTNQISEIMEKVYECFDISEESENTIEINPGTVDLCKLTEIKNAKFNRLSIGMQSANDDELRELGRIHDYETFEMCYYDARKAGFDNINIDVMTALSNQNEEKLKYTLNRVIGLNPEHIAAYSLIIEEDTAFFDKYGDIEGPVVGEDEERKLYHMTSAMLEVAGYEHYEISNFARKGYRSNHNCGYWTRTGYIGVGLGASSLIKYQDNGNEMEKRIRNTTDFDEYLSNPMIRCEEETITIDESMDEFMFLGLRMLEGVDCDVFENTFNESVSNVYGASVDKMIREGLLKLENNRLSLTRNGIDYGNYVFSQFMR